MGSFLKPTHMPHLLTMRHKVFRSSSSTAPNRLGVARSNACNALSSPFLHKCIERGSDLGRTNEGASPSHSSQLRPDCRDARVVILGARLRITSRPAAEEKGGGQHTELAAGLEGHKSPRSAPHQGGAWHTPRHRLHAASKPGPRQGLPFDEKAAAFSSGPASPDSRTRV